MPSADAGPVAGQDFHVEVHELPEGAGILVVHLQVINAKIALFDFFSVHSFSLY